MGKNSARAIVLVLALSILGGFFWYNTGEKSNAPASASQLPYTEEVKFRDQAFDIVQYKPGKGELRLFWKDGNGKPYRTFEALRADLEEQGKTLLFATNAGIYSENHTPGGLHIEDGQELKSLNLRDGYGNFHMMPNGVFYLGAEGAAVVESSTYGQDNPQATLGTQSGPMLVIENKLHPAFNEGSANRRVRNGVGVDEKGNIWFAISESPVNFYDFALLFREQLHCPNALYLDGSLSGFYAPELGRNDANGEYCGILAIVD